MAKCQVCAYENEDGAEYCEECGVRMGGAPAAPPQASAVAPIPHSTASALSVAAQPAADVEPPSPPAPEPVAAPAPAAANGGAAAQAEPAGGSVGCTGCGAPMPDGTKFCPKCGARQDAGEPAPSAAPGKCPACGADSEPGATFCMSCGARVSTEAAPPAAARPKGEVIRLRMVAGKDKDKLFEIEKTEVRIGRLNENDIPLESDGYVSGKHTRISKQGGEFFVEDLGSTNGTFLKVRKLTRLSPGDEIKVGQSIFRLE